MYSVHDHMGVQYELFVTGNRRDFAVSYTCFNDFLCNVSFSFQHLGKVLCFCSKEVVIRHLQFRISNTRYIKFNSNWTSYHKIEGVIILTYNFKSALRLSDFEITHVITP